VRTIMQVAGFIGVGLAAAAYVPQIWHLVRAHCSAGVSRSAFGLWLGAALLVTASAITTGAVLFIVLGGVQITATTLILVYATKYRSSACAGHAQIDRAVTTALLPRPWTDVSPPTGRVRAGSAGVVG
jgi:uncharacterized protein with PQ loop repeat